MVTRRTILAGGALTVTVAAAVGVYRTETLRSALDTLGVQPHARPSAADNAVLKRCRTRLSALLDTATAVLNRLGTADSELVAGVEMITTNLGVQLEAIGGRPVSDVPESSEAEDPERTDDIDIDGLIASLEKSATETADDAKMAQSTALVRTLASMSVGQRQLVKSLRPHRA